MDSHEWKALLSTYRMSGHRVARALERAGFNGYEEALEHCMASGRYAPQFLEQHFSQTSEALFAATLEHERHGADSQALENRLRKEIDIGLHNLRSVPQSEIPVFLSKDEWRKEIEIWRSEEFGRPSGGITADDGASRKHPKRTVPRRS